LGVLVRELTTFYSAFVACRPVELPELPVQYADFAHWQREALAGEMKAHLAYWKGELAGAPPLLELPTDYPRPASLTTAGATRRFSLPAALVGALDALSRREGATLFMTLLAAFNVLLMRYSGQEDIVVGTPLANRTCVETEGMIGCFINPAALRSDLSGNPCFGELLARVRE